MPATSQRQRAERAVLGRRLTRMAGEIVTAATLRMDEEHPWFRALPPRERAAIGSIVQAGLTGFVTWFESDNPSPISAPSMFASAPRELTRAIKLQQTVELVRTTMDVFDGYVDVAAGPNLQRQRILRDALLVFSREVAFAAADVYARAAETRGAWDTRLADLLIEAVLSNAPLETLQARASAADWATVGNLVALVGPVSQNQDGAEVQIEAMRRTARSHELSIVVGVNGGRLVALASSDQASPAQIAKLLSAHFGAGTVVVSYPVSTLAQLAGATQAAVAGFRALPLTALSERVVTTDDLLAPRAIMGDQKARAHLSALIREQLNPDLQATLGVFLEIEPTIEGCARRQFLHVNTVRYRLRRITELTGLDPTDPQDALRLRLGLMYARVDL